MRALAPVDGRHVWRVDKTFASGGGLPAIETKGEFSETGVEVRQERHPPRFQTAFGLSAWDMSNALSQQELSGEK
jgi:hypothetical protein